MMNGDKPNENPYSAPSASEATGECVADLRIVATYQKGVLYCILIQIISLVVYGAVSEDVSYIANWLAFLAFGCSILGGTVFVFLLATNQISTITP